MTPPLECRVAFAPYQPVLWRPKPPSAETWRWLRDNARVKGVRLQYLADDPQWWPEAFVAAAEIVEIHGNFCIADMTKWTPVQIEEAVFVWMIRWGKRMASVSFMNEIGYAVGFDGIPAWVTNFWLPFYRGVRRANQTIPIYGVDAESVETQALFEKCLLAAFPDKKLQDIIQYRGVHNYGDQADDGELDYATMTGENGKDGFMSLSHEIPTIVSEIDEQQWKEARARGEFRGVATDAEVDHLTAFCVRMRDEFGIRSVTIGTYEYFCTRVVVQLDNPPLVPPRDPPYTWSTATHGSGPVMSEAGKRLAAVFSPVKVADVGHRMMGRRG